MHTLHSTLVSICQCLQCFLCVGCTPHVFVPHYTPVGQHLEVPCSQAHPSLRGVMLWKCVHDITWDGELSGCTFEEDVDREVGLLHFIFSSNETVVSGKMSEILTEVHVTCSSGQVHS